MCTGSPVARDRVGLGIHRAGCGWPAILPRTRVNAPEITLAGSMPAQGCVWPFKLGRPPWSWPLDRRVAVGPPARPVYDFFPAAGGCGGRLKPSATRRTRTPQARRPAGRGFGRCLGRAAQLEGAGSVTSTATSCHCPGLARVASGISSSRFSGPRVPPHPCIRCKIPLLALQPHVTLLRLLLHAPLISGLLAACLANTPAPSGSLGHLH